MRANTYRPQWPWPGRRFRIARIRHGDLVRASIEQPDLAEKVRFLSAGAHLREPDVEVQTVQTHFAWVFLTPKYAYKLRKPVRHRDFETVSLASRRARSDEEIRINRELAPDVYLDVIPLARAPDGRMRLIEPSNRTGEMEIVDWLLRMRRLPDARMLDHMIRERSWRPADLQAVRDHLPAVYW